MAANLPWAARALTLAAALATSGAAAQADDIGEGRNKARACAVCHGVLGLSVAPDTPNLAGQPASYLVQQLRAYRSGARRHEVMAVMAKPLQDSDIDQLAAWFAAIRVEASPPR